MFTGIIEGIGTLLRLERRGRDMRMTIRPEFPFENPVIGESIAVDGVCLTLVQLCGTAFCVDVSIETLQRTTLGKKSPGAHVNLERALRIGDRLGGHLVLGHVDGMGTLVERSREGRSWRLVFQVPKELSSCIVEKGSIAINGVSLTVNGCSGEYFHVNIVPHTAKVTTIDELAIGDKVNVETDIIGKYIEKMVRVWIPSLSEERRIKPEESTIDEKFLREHGF